MDFRPCCACSGRAMVGPGHAAVAMRGEARVLTHLRSAKGGRRGVLVSGRGAPRRSFAYGLVRDDRIDRLPHRRSPGRRRVGTLVPGPGRARLSGPRGGGGGMPRPGFASTAHRSTEPTATRTGRAASPTSAAVRRLERDRPLHDAADLPPGDATGSTEALGADRCCATAAAGRASASMPTPLSSTRRRSVLPAEIVTQLSVAARDGHVRGSRERGEQLRGDRVGQGVDHTVEAQMRFTTERGLLVAEDLENSGPHAGADRGLALQPEDHGPIPRMVSSSSSTMPCRRCASPKSLVCDVSACADMPAAKRRWITRS